MTRDNQIIPATGRVRPADHSGACSVLHRASRGAGIARTLLLFLLGAHLALASALGARAAEPEKKDEAGGAQSQEEMGKAAEQFMTLGLPGGPLGGERKKEFELNEIKSQILTFIPPLLRPVLTQHAFILPPKTYSVGLSQKYVNLDGDDYFKGGSVDPVFKHRNVERNFTDLDLFYGFDLNRKYLHAFTVKVNVPYINTDIGGHLHPVGGAPLPSVASVGSSTDLGDIGVFLKKKVLDQGNRSPVGLAVVGGVFFPTGDNDEKFNSPTITTTPGGPMLGTFGRFSDDGRLPSPAQPGTGAFSYLAGAFLTRQFSHGAFPGRSALHIGAAHKFISGDDGIDPGDETTYFASFVKPIYKDFLAVDLSVIGKHLEDDSYTGTFFSPAAGGIIPRPSFSGGDFHFVGTSLIFSPDPQIRFTASGLYRISDPDLGPAPPWVARFGLDVIF